MKTKHILLLPLFLISFKIVAQDNGNKTEAYYGQTPPGSTPMVFAPGIISSEEFEFGGTFSKDGKEFYFTRRPTYQGSDNRIYYSSFNDGKWTKPERAPFAENVFEFEPVMSPSGDKMYFYSRRQGDRDSRYEGDLWVTEKTEEGWSEPVYFLSPVNAKYLMSVSPAADGSLYFSGYINGKRGIYRSENVSGVYPEMEYLSENINSTFYAHPFVAPDESYIIMDAQITGMGKPELFISFRSEDGGWTKPVNMGPAINATKTEFGASVSPDGKYLFFHRRIEEQGDIFWVDANIIEFLKQENMKE